MSGLTGCVVSGCSTGSYSYSQPVQQTYYSAPVQRVYSSPTYYNSAPAVATRRATFARPVRNSIEQCHIVHAELERWAKIIGTNGFGCEANVANFETDVTDRIVKELLRKRKVFI